MISHFDSDHVGGIIEILENMKVKNIIISHQYEENILLEKVIKLCNKKRINIILVKAGDIIKIDKYLNLQILWPDEKNIIKENQINNNSIVARIEYFNFKVLFTGDVEKIAEEEIINKYLENTLLEAQVLKVAHHGSKTSSTIEFLEKVKPKIALIGVGKENKFGHPNLEVISKIESIGSKIYRTDMDGEISIVVDKKGRVKLKKFIE